MAVNPVIGLPPSTIGAVHDTVAEESPGTAETPVGAFGDISVVTDKEGLEGSLIPITFRAVTLKV